jgi:predicted DNA-binding transcriptional regulator AlpA
MTTAETTTPTRHWRDFLHKIDPIDDRTLRWPDVIRITGLSKSQAKLKISENEFPAPFLISDTGRSLGWHASEVSAWCAARDAQREAMRGQPRVINAELKKLKHLRLKKLQKLHEATHPKPKKVVRR